MNVFNNKAESKWNTEIEWDTGVWYHNFSKSV